MDNKLGEFLRQRRGTMSLREFAAKCNISHTHLDSIEKGADPRTGKRVSVSTETLRLIANGIDVDYLFLACLADGVDPTRDVRIHIPDDYVTRKVIPINLQEFSSPQSKNGGLTVDDGFTYAMYEESKELTEESKQKLIEMAKFFKQQQEKEKEQK